MEPRIQYAKTEDGVSIACWTLGEGMPLICHAPLVLSHLQLEWQIPELRTWYEQLAQRRQLVRFDYRGQGLSERNVSDLSPEAFLLDLDAVANRFEFERFALYSLGPTSPWALTYAAEHPDRVTRLVLWQPQAKVTPVPSRLVVLMQEDWITYTETMAHSLIGWSGAEGEMAHRWAGFMRDSVSQEAWLEFSSHFGDVDATPILPQISSPTLVLASQQATEVSEIAAQMQNAQVVFIEGHLILGDINEGLCAIDEFLDDNKEATAAEQQDEPQAPTAPAAVVRRKGARPAEPRIQYAKTEDGVNIAYTASGEGLPLLYMPYTGFSHVQLEWRVSQYRSFFEELSLRQQLIRFDRRGSGMSERDVSDFSLDAFVLDLDAVVKRLGLESLAIFAGISSGAAAITYAANNPELVTHLILFCTAARSSDVTPRPNSDAARKLIDTDWEVVSETFARTGLGWNAGKVASQVAELIRASTTPELYKASRAARDGQDVSALLPKVQAETLVIHRQDIPQFDMSVPRELAATIPNAQLLLVEGSSVNPMKDESQTVLAAIDEFLDDGGNEESQANASAQSGDASKTQISSPPEAKAFASGRYVVVKLLGQGAQKSVYLVDDTRLGRQCALSMLNAALLDPGDADRIKREAQTMAQFGTQQNIVTVYDYGEEDGAPFIVCEYVPGGELRDELSAAAGPLALDRALAVAIDICRALSFAHGEDIVHRDLKPENIWLTKDGSAKLGDFGIALALGRTRLTMPGGLTGTATYMAPEQVSGGDVDARSDLYAFGVLLYELVAGRPPFVGDDPNAIMYQHVNAEPESPVQDNETVPPSLEKLIMKLLAKAQAERPASAEEVLAELEQAAQELAGGLSTAIVGKAPASSPIEQEIRFCTSADGTRIAYATYGEPAAPPLVVVQNFEDVQELSWNHSLGRPLLEGLASGRRLVTFDRRGVGGSQRDVDDLTIPAQVADLVAVVDQLGLKSFDLIAWANGGPLASAYAVEHPERVGRLVLWAPMILTSGPPPQSYLDMAQSIRVNWSLARRSWAAIARANEPAEQRWFSNMLRDSIAPEVAARHIEVSAEFDPSALLPNIQAPTLVLANRRDRGGRSAQSDIDSIQAVASLIPDARFLTLEGATATLGVFKLLFAALRSFLDEADAEAEAGT